jgi:hypothetical protein
MAIRAPQPQSESSEQVSLLGCFVTLCVLVSLGFMVYHFSGTSSGDDEPSNDTWSQNTTSTFDGQPSSSFDDRGVPVTSASGSSDSIAPWPGNRDPSFLQRPTLAAQSRTNSTLEIRTFLRDRKWSPELASQIAQSTQAIQEREGLDLKPAVHRALSPFRLERPASGRAFRFQMREGVAPLRVATRIEGSQSADYFIKLVDVQSGQRVFGFYVHGGQTSETQVPLRCPHVLYQSL